jgi:hypothetical protein
MPHKNSIIQANVATGVFKSTDVTMKMLSGIIQPESETQSCWCILRHKDVGVGSGSERQILRGRTCSRWMVYRVGWRRQPTERIQNGIYCTDAGFPPYCG